MYTNTTEATLKDKYLTNIYQYQYTAYIKPRRKEQGSFCICNVIYCNWHGISQVVTEVVSFYDKIVKYIQNYHLLPSIIKCGVKWDPFANFSGCTPHITMGVIAYAIWLLCAIHGFTNGLVVDNMNSLFVVSYIDNIKHVVRGSHRTRLDDPYQWRTRLSSKN